MILFDCRGHKYKSLCHIPYSTAAFDTSLFSEIIKQLIFITILTGMDIA